MSEQPTDKNGTVFRPGFHRVNSDGTPFRGTHGQFMPRGGRKPKAQTATVAAPAPSPQPVSAPAPSPVTPTVAPVGSEPLPVSAADVTPLQMPIPDVPTAGGSSAELPPNPSETAQPPPTGGTAGTAEKKAEDNSQSAAECVTSGVEFIAGLVFDAPEDFTSASAEHAGMTKATAAWIRARGWNFAAGFAVFFVFAAWILKSARKPKARETVKNWMKRTAPERARNVTPPENSPKPQPDAKATRAASDAIIDIPANIPPLAK